jgi:uncharacterized protein (DUF433 family)
MSVTIQISPETYQLLQRWSKDANASPDQLAEAAIRTQLDYTTHLEQRPTRSGPQTYIRNTRVAVWHIAAFLQAGHTAGEIVDEGLPHLPPAAIYEAIAYYYNHQDEIEAELEANKAETINAQLRQQLSPEQYAQLTGQQT